ncbi:MAG: hypothetical protein IJ558_02410 [Treponema sp.]|nr:hypothetical protein [Treponema sp.]
MKRDFFCGVLVLSALALIGCSDLFSTASVTVQNQLSATQKVVYTTESDIFALDYTTGTLVIEGSALGGKTVYYASVNTSSSDISSSRVKLISSSNHRGSVASAGDVTILPFSATDDGDARQTHVAHAHFYDWKPRSCESAVDAFRTIDNPVSVSGIPVAQITDYTIGTTKKRLWTLSGTDRNGNALYAQRDALLYAYNGTCNVWIVSGDSYIKADTREELAQKIADAFTAFYPVVRAVFGNESDNVYYSSTGSRWQTAPMDYLSDTGTKVNIVLYDLYTDKTEGKVLGLFNGMDYYPSDADYQKISGSQTSIGSYSNEGKYFYLDSYFATTEPDVMISTLAHEFQHMINFGVKSMNGLSMDTNFNEMLSMLCEDMMQRFLTEHGWEVSDSDSPRGRLLQFVIDYFDCGIRDYDESSLSYANAYAFGAWLCRQYGGASLVKEMMANQRVNNDCILAAVNAVNKTSYDFTTLFGQFIKACYGKDDTYTFNRDADERELYDDGVTTYSYPMTAINFWQVGSMYDLRNQRTSATVYTTWKETLDNRATSSKGKNLLDAEYPYFGPAVFTQGALYPYLMAKYGMLLSRKTNVIPDDTTRYTLTFSTTSGETSPGMVTYVYIK